MGFENRFWGVTRLRASQHDLAGDAHQLVAAYLDWRLIALDHNAILICRSAGDRPAVLKQMIILEGDLMHYWLRYRSNEL
jgi:hypothetical protein